MKVVEKISVDQASPSHKTGGDPWPIEPKSLYWASISPKVAKRAVTLKLRPMMEPRFDAENLLQGVLHQALLATN